MIPNEVERGKIKVIVIGGTWLLDADLVTKNGLTIPVQAIIRVRTTKAGKCIITFPKVVARSKEMK